MAEHEEVCKASTISKRKRESPPFVEVICTRTKKTWRFVAGTEAKFAVKMINGNLEMPGTHIEAVKDGEQPVIFGPNSVLVNYGDGWNLHTTGDPDGFGRAKQDNKVLMGQAYHPLATTMIRLKKEQEEQEDKRQYRAQAHLYKIIKVARDEDLREQIGKDKHFDLVDHDKVHSFRIQKQMPFNLFKEEVAKELDIPVQFQQFWIWAKRKNHTYRPHHPLTPQEELQSVGQLREVSDKTNNAELKLFLEVEFGQKKKDLHPIPPPDKSNEEILIFFKLYDPEKEQLRYVGRLFVKSTGKPIQILTKLNELAGFAPDQEIELFEEMYFEPSVMCERLDKRTSFRFSQIGDGDILYFQKRPAPEIEEQLRYPDVPSFLEYVKNRQNCHTFEKPVKIYN